MITQIITFMTVFLSGLSLGAVLSANDHGRQDLVKVWGAILVFFLLAGLFLTFAAPVKVESSDAVVERDGVLYFPDGNPVRNYEQLYIYEHSN